MEGLHKGNAGGILIVGEPVDNTMELSISI